MQIFHEQGKRGGCENGDVDGQGRVHFDGGCRRRNRNPESWQDYRLRKKLFILDEKDWERWTWLCCRIQISYFVIGQKDFCQRAYGQFLQIYHSNHLLSLISGNFYINIYWYFKISNFQLLRILSVDLNFSLIKLLSKFLRFNIWKDGY